MGVVVLFSLLGVFLCIMAGIFCGYEEILGMVSIILVGILCITMSFGFYKKELKKKVPTLNKQIAEYDLKQAEIKLNKLREVVDNNE